MKVNPMKSSINKLLLVSLFSCTTLMSQNGQIDTQLAISSLVDHFVQQDNKLKRAINLSGKQRMLTQNITKLVLQIHLNINKEESLKKLKALVALYDRTLLGFLNGDSGLDIKAASNAEVKAQINIVKKEWKMFYKDVKDMYTGNDNSEQSFEYILMHNEKLLKVSDDLVKAYEASNSSKNYLEIARLRVVNVAGRQRMLTQKMTKEKLLLSQGKKEYKEKFLKTVKLFDDSLHLLIEGNNAINIPKPSNDKIVAQLNRVEKRWQKLKPLYLKEKNSKKGMKTIIDENTILLKEMDSMVQMAEKELEY